jgi:hypothetical protein
MHHDVLSKNADFKATHTKHRVLEESCVAVAHLTIRMEARYALTSRDIWIALKPGGIGGPGYEARRDLARVLALNGHVLDGSMEATLVSNGQRQNNGERDLCPILGLWA